MKIECMVHVASLDAEGMECNSLRLTPGDYTFHYDYPLASEVTFEHHLTEQSTILDVLLLGQHDYRAIYDAEDAAVGKTGNIPGMLNRHRSAGPYGIWGHHIEDLFFERVDIDDFHVHFRMGS